MFSLLLTFLECNDNQCDLIVISLKLMITSWPEDSALATYGPIKKVKMLQKALIHVHLHCVRSFVRSFVRVFKLHIVLMFDICIQLYKL